ncbi:MAG: ShlB/FhaC/HecB family hemolysin secretion/activation protein [Sphingobium limneticum]
MLIENRSRAACGLSGVWFYGVASLALVSPAWGQSAAPSSITPPTLLPPAHHGDTAPTIPQAEGLKPPKGAEELVVRLEGVDVVGGFPEVAVEIRAITAKFVGREVTLAELYAAASAVEAAHARHGFVLARVVVPPQQLVSGGRFRLVVIDGFIESVDVSGVPERVRSSVAARAGFLAGRRHLTLDEIERPLLLAGEVPGLILASTLAPGIEQGGARLLLSGRQSLVSGNVSVENGFVQSLGRVGVTAQVSVNSLLGLGEQIYGFAVSGYDLTRVFDDDAPVRVLGGGIVLAPGDGRLSLNTEVTYSHTRPEVQPGIPLTRGKLRRLSFRGGYVLEKTRSSAMSINGTVEQIQESNDAIDFGVRLSLDRFVVGRLGASYSRTLVGGTVVVATAQISHGLGGLDAGQLASGMLPSRQGADTDFTKATIALRVAAPVGGRYQFRLFGRGQTSFGQSLFRSEQTALEGSDALSAYTGGMTAVDAAVTARAELGGGLALAGKRKPLRLAPYVFVAAGTGWIERPTAVEKGGFTLANLGAGTRGAIAGTRLTFALEYAHGFSALARFDKVDRISLSAAIGF